MRTAPKRADEESRLQALSEFDALHVDLDPRLDEIVALARDLFDVPIALVSLVARERQVFAARSGLEACETSRDVSFCSHALGSDEMLVVPDALLDPRFTGNPLVAGAPFIRFYAGTPLRSRSGHDIGTLCIIDTRPRNGLSGRDRKALRDLGKLVLDQLELRRLSVASDVSQSRFRNIAATSPDAIICADHEGRISFWNETATRLFGFSETEAVGSPIDIIVPEGARGGHDGGLERVARGGKPRLVGKTVELEARHKDGSSFPIELSLSMWWENGQANFGAIMRDITGRRQNEDRLYQLAHHDWLTALPNRSVLIARLSEAIAAEQPFSLMLLDLDRFKEVNDTLGHTVGDAVLKEVAERVLTCVRGIDTAARLGGDEFAVLMPGAGSDQTKLVASRLIAGISAPFVGNGQLLHIGASIGVARYPEDGDRAEELLSNADLALYQAKREGRGCKRAFSAELRAAAMTRRAFEGELRRAFEKEEFVLFYQPQVSMADGRLIGAEALLRWQHPTRGLLLPSAFLQALEDGMLAHDVGGWVMETACAQAASWRRCVDRDFRIGVNLFEAQFRENDLCERVQAVLARTGLPATALELEVTENVILRYDTTMRDELAATQALGVGIAFDDFGTGFASLSMVKNYPLNRLKIDRSFVEHICVDPADAVIVSAIAALGRGLGLDVIAEGVETKAQRDMLHAAGCTSAQGYLFGCPMAAEEFRATVLEIERASERLSA